VRQRKALVAKGSGCYIMYFAERSDLTYIGTQRRQTGSDRRQRRRAGRQNEQAVTKDEQPSYSLSTSAKCFSFCATVHILVMRGKKINLAPRLNSTNRNARVVTRRGVARRVGCGGGGGGARVREPSSHMLIQHGEESTLCIGPNPPKLERLD
jgi:hypothetical protein